MLNGTQEEKKESANEGTWLLGQGGGEGGGLEEGDVEAQDEKLEELVEWTRREKVVAAGAFVSAGASVATMLILDSTIVLVFGLLGVFVPLYSVFQEQKITEIEAIAETREALSRDLQQFEESNAELSKEKDQLSGVNDRLKELSSTMSEIKDKESASLDILEESLENSKQILERLGTKRLTAVINNVFDIALTCDEDGDMQLSDEEIDRLILSIEGIQGVDINNDDLKQMIIDGGRNIDALMEIIKDAFDSDPDTDDDGDKLFSERPGAINFRSSMR